MKATSKIAAVGLTLYLACIGAHACQVRGIDPARLTLDAQPVVFIGMVKTSTRQQTTFLVEKPIRGVSGGEIAVKNNPPSSCTHVFKPGERWLYAGDFTGSPSVRLEPGATAQHDHNYHQE